MKKHVFYYQPDKITCTTDWCWTFILLIGAIAFWIEVTHINWISVFVILVFFFISGLELRNRQLVLTKRELIVKNMFGGNQKVFARPINHYVIKSHQIVIGKHQYLISKKTGQKLKQLLKS